jgi:aspartate kinase
MATLTHRKLIEELKEVAKVEIDEGYELISLIGNDLHARPSIAKEIFSTIADINIRMMSLGASPYNFNFLVKEADSTPVMTKLHKRLIEGQ